MCRSPGRGEPRTPTHRLSCFLRVFKVEVIRSTGPDPPPRGQWVWTGPPPVPVAELLPSTLSFSLPLLLRLFTPQSPPCRSLPRGFYPALPFPHPPPLFGHRDLVGRNSLTGREQVRPQGGAHRPVSPGVGVGGFDSREGPDLGLRSRRVGAPPRPVLTWSATFHLPDRTLPGPNLF